MRKGRTTRNPRPDRRARRPVTACLRAVARLLRRYGAAMGAAMARLWRGYGAGYGGAAMARLWRGMARHIAPEPVSPLRPPFMVGLTANAKGTHAEKGERSILL